MLFPTIDISALLATMLTALGVSWKRVWFPCSDMLFAVVLVREILLWFIKREELEAAIESLVALLFTNVTVVGDSSK